MGTTSSGKLTARRVRETVSNSSSSSLSRSAAFWPMSAHRRHFLFHTGGDVTWKRIYEKRAFITWRALNAIFCRPRRCKPYEANPNAFVSAQSSKPSLYWSRFLVTVTTKDLSEIQTWSRTLSGLLMTELSVAALGTFPSTSSCICCLREGQPSDRWGVSVCVGSSGSALC